MDSVRVIPFYFGSGDVPLFGWLHLPEGEWSGARVVLCPPLGYEGLFAHPTLRHVANRLATSQRAAVLRFDYPGAGDSSGSDERPDLVARWVDAARTATEELRHRAPADGPTVVLGMRAGALIAVEAARRSNGVSALVLWAPVTKGKAFVREQKAFAKMAHLTAAGDGDQATDWGPGGFEANGTVFTSQTVAALGDLDLTTLERPPAASVLVLDRDDVPGSAADLVPWGAVAAVEFGSATGYAAMMAPPLSLELPLEATEVVCRWIGSLASSWSKAPPVPTPDLASSTRVAEGVLERAVWYDAGGELFGILTTPEGSNPRRALLLLNNAAGNRTGPNAMYTSLARDLASDGSAATFRIDLAGIGDSALPEGRPPHHCYALDPLDDVRAAMAKLRGFGFEEIVVGGLCSGAYLAWHAALSLDGVSGLVLVNPQTFSWTDGDITAVDPLGVQYETQHYQESVKSGDKWLKLLRGQVDLRYVAGVMTRAAAIAARARLLALRTRLPWTGRSEVARRMQDLLASGMQVHFIFGRHDPGLANLRAELGGRLPRFKARFGLDKRIVDGPDHSFTPRWARRLLVQHVREIMRS
jgi:alpha-beta hydrolase superfamily lysophospholipase